MKFIKKFIISLLVVLCLSLCSCSGTKEEEKENIPSGSPDIYMLTDQYGLIGKKFAGTDDGCYEILQNPNFFANIVYTDYESRSKIFLNSDPGRDPYSPENNSYIPDCYGTVVLFATSDRLIVLKSTTPQAVEWYGEKSLSSLTLMNQDGSDKNKFYTFEANEWINSQSGVACDGENIYLIESILDGETTRHMYVVKIGFETGEKSVLKELDPSQKWYIIGACGRKLVLKNLSVMDPEKPWHEQLSTQTHNIVRFDVDSSRESDLISYVQGEKVVISQSDRLYVLDPRLGSISSQDVLTGESEIVFEYKDNEIDGVKYDEVNLRRDLFDNHLLLEGVKADNTVDFIAVALSDKSAKKVNVYNGDTFCGIFCESDDYFFVQSGEKQVDVTIPAPDGSEYVSNTRVMVMSLIKKEDYWAGNANLIPITDYVYN